jgi:outer membrane protein assembly factor BamB
VHDFEVAWAWMDKTHIVSNFISAPGNSITDGFGSNFKLTTIFSAQMQPIVADGHAFFGSMNGTMYAVDSLTGANDWDFDAAGPIMGSAAYDQDVLVFGSMDGKVYGLDADDGSLIWQFPTGAGISAAPVIHDGIVYVGSRSGSFYAIDVLTGSQEWKYDVRDPNNSNFNKAPIMAPAAISEDGNTVLFGAENLNFYGLNTSNGAEKWTPKKLVGQSFLHAWPVVKGDYVVVRTMSSLEGAEGLMDNVLAGLAANPTWSEEKTAILNWLNQNPHQKSMYVFQISTGTEPYQVAMGRVTGNNYTAHPPVVDNQNRLLTYWRSKHSTLFNDQGTFGSVYCPDISAMDLTTGDRVTIANSQTTKLSCPELDNGFQPTIGGNQLYLFNHFRGTHTINLSTGQKWGITSPMSVTGDSCPAGSFRGTGEFWGVPILYYGNDADNGECYPANSIPPKAFSNTTGFAGITIASTNGQSLLYINETDAGAIVAIRHDQ